jgi:polyribonucleotide nucleotidyltransferase
MACFLKKKVVLLHYNFPPFSTGETGRMTGPGRRDWQGTLPSVH